MKHVFKPLLLLLIGVFAPFWVTRADRIKVTPSESAQAAPAAQSTQSAVGLVEGFRQERDLNGGGRHSYQITIKNSQYVKLVVKPKGIDVNLRLFGPDSKLLTEIDSPNRSDGSKVLAGILPGAGTYLIEVVSVDAAAAAGKYDVTVETLRAPTETEQVEEEITDLLQTADTFLERGKYDEAIPLTRQALEKGELVLGKNHPLVAYGLNSLARLYRAKGEYQKAEPLYLRAIEIFGQVQGPEHPETVIFISNLGALYREMGEYAKAKSLQERVLAIRKKILGPNHPDVATTLNNLATLYRDLGSFSQAETLYLQALAVREKALGADHTLVSESLNNLAALYWSRAEYSKAEPLFERAFAISQKRLGPTHPKVAIFLSNLGELRRLQGDYARAEALHQQVLTIREKVLGPYHPDVARTYHNLALVCKNNRDLAKAEPMYQKALAIWEKVVGPQHPEVAQTLNNLAELYRLKKDFVPAEALHQRALAIREKASGPNHPDVAQTLNNLGQVYRDQGQYTQAEAMFRRALALREKVWGTSHPDVAATLVNLAGMYQINGDISPALAAYAQANEITEQDLRRNLSTGSEQQKLAYLNTTSAQTHQTISIQTQSAGNNPEALRTALTVVLRRKGRALDAMTSGIELLRRRATPEDQILLDELAASKQQLAAITLRGPGPDGFDTYQQRIKTLTEQAERAEARVSVRSAEYQVQTRPITLEAVQQVIPPRTVLVEFATYRPFDPKTQRLGRLRYVVYILASEGLPKSVDLGEVTPINQLITEFRQALREKVPVSLPSPKTTPVRTVENLKTLAQKLYTQVMRPVISLVPPSTRLLLAPDGELNILPFGALMDTQGKFFIERFKFTYLTSGRDLLRLQTKFEPQSPPLAIANPDYGTGSGPALNGEQLKPLIPLPFTAEEGARIHQLYPKSILKVRQEATKQAVLEAHRPQILHLATHGGLLSQKVLAEETRLDQQRNLTGLTEDLANSGEILKTTSLLQSALFFAGANTGSTATEGNSILTALEVAGLDLWGTKLTVLSACETALGQITNGEGVYGLRRALVLAGSESQVMSLWKVSDQGTKELMSGFYRRLKAGEGRSDALQNTQLELLKSRRWNHPFYWASFIQSGEWGNLEGKR